MKTIFVYSGEMGQFNFGNDHPYKPERAIKTFDLCTRYGVMNHPWMTILNPNPIDPDLLTLFHKPALIEAIEKASRGEFESRDAGIRFGDRRQPDPPGYL